MSRSNLFFGNRSFGFRLGAHQDTGAVEIVRGATAGLGEAGYRPSLAERELGSDVRRVSVPRGTAFLRSASFMVPRAFRMSSSGAGVARGVSAKECATKLRSKQMMSTICRKPMAQPPGGRDESPERNGLGDFQGESILPMLWNEGEGKQ